jgi:hypothetical protein
MCDLTHLPLPPLLFDLLRSFGAASVLCMKSPPFHHFIIPHLRSRCFSPSSNDLMRRPLTPCFRMMKGVQ